VPAPGKLKALPVLGIDRVSLEAENHFSKLGVSCLGYFVVGVPNEILFNPHPDRVPGVTTLDDAAPDLPPWRCDGLLSAQGVTVKVTEFDLG
jgi:hypothetical protein